MGQGPRQRPRWREVAPGRFDQRLATTGTGGVVTALWPAASTYGTDEEKRERERGGTALHAAPLRKADGGARDIRIAGMCPYGELRRLRRLGLRCQDEREGEEEQEGVREDGGLTLSAMARSEKSGAAGIGAERERRRRSAARKNGTPSAIWEAPRRFLRPRGRGGYGGGDASVHLHRGIHGRRRFGKGRRRPV